MQTTQTEFAIPNGITNNNLLDLLGKNFTVTMRPQKTVVRTIYDSFDWRLYSNGAALELHEDGEVRQFFWREDKEAPLKPLFNQPKAPKFVADLPEGEFRQQLARVLEMRELVPQVKIDCRETVVNVLNADEKTVVRVHIDEHMTRSPDSKTPSRFGRRAVVKAVRGYPKPYQRVVDFLQEQKFAIAKNNLLRLALAVTGRSPDEYSSRLKLRLDPEMRADQAAREILLRLLKFMQINEAGVIQGTDTEFLHDFRVAVRRTRSALSQIREVFPAAVEKKYKAEFAWLGQITTPTRDLDVYLLGFDDYRNRIPAGARADLTPLHEFLMTHRAIEQDALVKALKSARYRTLVKNWRALLESAPPSKGLPANAARPVFQLADERIWHIYNRSLKQGRAITPDSPAPDLHELRKTCKKLRYLMEFFQSLYPAREIRLLIRVLKSLQDNLGQFQDYEVQVSTLKRFSHQMVEENKVKPDTLLAMGMLIERMEDSQKLARQEFSDRFETFAATENVEHFRKIFVETRPNEREIET
jgi:CHAD domain-containing protein